MSLTIGKRIVGGFAVAILVTGALGAFSYFKVGHIETQSSRVVVDCLPGAYLSGQINAESIGPKLYSGPGGHLDFAISAAYGRNGRYVCALPSVAAGGTVSRIVPRLAHGSTVTVPRSLADVVVTEHGIARLRGLTTRERAEALIEVAHPDHRPQLRAAMKAGETSW